MPTHSVQALLLLLLFLPSVIQSTTVILCVMCSFLVAEGGKKRGMISWMQPSTFHNPFYHQPPCFWSFPSSNPMQPWTPAERQNLKVQDHDDVSTCTHILHEKVNKMYMQTEYGLVCILECNQGFWILSMKQWATIFYGWVYFLYRQVGSLSQSTVSTGFCWNISLRWVLLLPRPITSSQYVHNVKAHALPRDRQPGSE